MNNCHWTAEGTLRTKPTLTHKGKRSYATIHLEIEGGEIVAFAHDETIIKDIRCLKPQDSVRLTGIIEPRDPELGSTKPYFLNVVYLEPLTPIASQFS
jgi:hypothetical protein